jgi:hypothetical protein
MPKGIFNPFKEPEKPKPKFKSPIQDLYDTEIGGSEPKGGVRLDGDTYVLWLLETLVEEVPSRLGALIQEVATAHPGQLLRYGIHLVPLGDTYATETTDSVLKTPQGRLHVHTGILKEGDDAEILAFRRIGHALHSINVPDILKKHNAKIIVRK